MLILTNKDGEIVGHFLNSKTAFECCWAMYQLDPESKIWGLDETPEQKRLIDRTATNWMVVQFNQKPIANWIRYRLLIELYDHPIQSKADSESNSLSAFD